MTKNPEFQKQLTEVVKEGIKPSHLKKLKRSKSADDIPTSSTANIPLKKSQSQLEIPLAPPTSTTKIKELEDKVSVLELKLDTKDRELQEKEVELKKTTAELDNSLFARVAAVKQFGKVYDKLQVIKQELNENVDQASDELVNQDEKISQYRTNQQKTYRRIQELEKDLNLAQRLAELRKYPLPNNSPELDYLKLAFYSLLTVIFTLWLLNSKPTQ